MIRSCLCSSRIIGRGSPPHRYFRLHFHFEVPQKRAGIGRSAYCALAVPEMLPPSVLPQIEPPEVVAATVEEPPTVNPATPPPDLDS